MSHQIEVPPELFAEWLAQGRRQYAEPALIAGFVAEKTAEWAADQQLMKVNNWIRCLEDSPTTGIRWELDILQLDRLGHELWQAMRPNPPSLKEQALAVLDDCADSIGAVHENALRRALESIPDEQ